LFSAIYWCVVGSVATPWVFSHGFQTLGYGDFHEDLGVFLGSFNVAETTFFQWCQLHSEFIKTFGRKIELFGVKIEFFCGQIEFFGGKFEFLEKEM